MNVPNVHQQNAMSNKHPNIKEAKLTHAEIARFFGFKTVKSFDRTSAHNRYMKGVENLLARDKKVKSDDRLKLIQELKHNTICARATLYPGKTIEEVTKIADELFDQIKDFAKRTNTIS